MGTKDKINLYTAFIKFSKVFFGCVVFIILLLFPIGEYICTDERDIAIKDCKIYDGEWYHVLENGERTLIEVPGKVPAEFGEVVTIATTLPQNIYNRQNICFRVVWQDVEVYIDGVLRQSYSTKDSRPFGKNSAFRYIFVELNETDAGKELEFCFSSESKYAGDIRTVYIGDKLSIWLNFLGKFGVKTGIAILLMFLSLFCIIICAILKYLYKKNLSFKYLAWTLFLSAFWMISEAEFRQLIFKNVSVLTNYTYLCLMILPIPLLIYINDIQSGRYRKIFIVPIIYSTGMTVIGTVLQLFDIVQFVQQLPFIHGAIAVAMLCIIVTITIDVFKRRISKYFFVGLGIYGMLVSAIIEIVLYYINPSYTLGAILSGGLVFLLIMAVIKTGQDLFEVERKKQKAIMSSKAKAQFLARMSHEIRTPINAVIGMNEMILRENENETIQEYAHNIQSASNMLLGLVNDVLDFSKIESGQLELVEDTYDLAQLIKDEKVLLNARANGKAISTQLDIDSGLPLKLFGDELRIKQIITNLLSNAVKYTKDGSVTLKSYFKWKDDETIELYFSVIDTGIGIKDSDMDKLFSSFKRLELEKNRNIEGTGLGLNIVKSLVDLMNGNITVESEYGKGSTFTVMIPQKVIDKQPIGDLNETVHKYKTGNSAQKKHIIAPDAKVLVVDDNIVNLSVTKALLKRSKVQVDCVESGKECLKLTYNKCYDIIFMDHMMPEMDGIETLKRLREDDSNPNKDSVVIALTANAIAGCREMYMKHGFNDYVSKPIQANKLDMLLIQYLPKKIITED